VLTVSQVQALVPLVRADGSEPFHAAWIARAAEVNVRRLEDDVEYALATGSFDPARLPALPDLACSPSVGGPAGVPTGAQATRSETEERERAHRSRPSLPCLPRLGRAAPRQEPRRGARGDARPRDRVSTPRKYRVLERDGWRCTTPGCALA
jgi:hypothetical protein